MPQNQWSAKRERQYEHIKQSQLKEGRGKEVAEEIAARTVNKERAQQGEAASSSPASTGGVPAGQCGGAHSRGGAAGRTAAQLYQEARQRNISGRSRMNKSQLQEALKG